MEPSGRVGMSGAVGGRGERPLPIPIGFPT